MKKLMTMMICAVLAIGAATAQNSKTITGYVVDKNGNPLAGAEVMAEGGGASAITDSDGSFSLDVHVLLKKLTASYAGMENNTLALGNLSNVVFTMKPYKKLTGFINLIGDIGYETTSCEKEYSSSWATYGVGIMGGQIGKWGWYGKGICNFTDDCPDCILTVGAIKQLGKSSSYLYFGAGLAYNGYTDGTGVAIDFGALFRIRKHFNVITGLNYCHTKSEYDEVGNTININVGVGYVF